MDGRHFDTLARLVSSTRSRRTVIAQALGGMLLGETPVTLLAKGRKTFESRADVKAKSKTCYPGTNCTPGKGKNTSGCDFAGSTAFVERDVRGANLSHSNFTGADLRGTDFRGA